MPKVTVKETRGIKNNNPLNIRENPGDPTMWVGERATDDDPIFEEFELAQHGIRAAYKTLLNYQKRYKLRSVKDMIYRWAPPVENHTTEYYKFVAKHMGIGPTEPVNLKLNKGNALRMIRAMILMENGYNPYSDELIMQGINMV